MSSPSDGYVMGRTSEEYQRLRRQARVWEPFTRRLLQQIDLQPGASCLDVGCGPGEVMRILGELAGPAGQVTGLDVDGKLGREALGLLQAEAGSRFAFVEGDAEAGVDLPEASFDLTFTRITLVHVKDPVGVLQRMFAWTRPGGFVVVQEYDFSPIGVYPEWPGWAEFDKVFHGVYDRAGRDVLLGRKLPACFARAGIGPPHGSDVGALIGPFSQHGAMLHAVYTSVLPAALQMGITTEAESAAFGREIARAQAEPYTVVWPLLVGVWARKPAAA